MRKKENIKGKEVDLEKKIDDVESQWSFKRIIIFSSIILALLFFAFYFFQARAGDVLGEKDMTTNSKGPQISIPKKEDVDEIVESAEENISNIDPNDIVKSQPQIQDAIKQLEKLTNKDNFKESLCSSICSE